MEETRRCRICFEEESSSFSKQKTENDQKGDKNYDDEYEDEKLISPCLCKGSIRWVHRGCLNQWRRHGILLKSLTHCSVCNFEYKIKSKDEQKKSYSLIYQLLFYLLAISLIFFFSAFITAYPAKEALRQVDIYFCESWEINSSFMVEFLEIFSEEYTKNDEQEPSLQNESKEPPKDSNIKQDSPDSTSSIESKDPEVSTSNIEKNDNNSSNSEICIELRNKKIFTLDVFDSEEKIISHLIYGLCANFFIFGMYAFIEGLYLTLFPPRRPRGHIQLGERNLNLRDDDDQDFRPRNQDERDQRFNNNNIHHHHYHSSPMYHYWNIPSSGGSRGGGGGGGGGGSSGVKIKDDCDCGDILKGIIINIIFILIIYGIIISIKKIISLIYETFQYHNYQFRSSIIDSHYLVDLSINTFNNNNNTSP